MELVAVDIGGTHARFSVAQIAADGAVTLGEVTTLATRDYASLATAWAGFAERHGAALPTAAGLSVAGPVGDAGDDARVIRLTNNPWTISPAALKATLGLSALTIINDFGAVGYAVAVAGDEHFCHLTGPDGPLPAAGTLSVVGPGTGLGVAHIWRDGQGGFHVQATEGGHVDFAPLDAIEDAILARLRARHRRVSVERVVSGPGLVDIYETLAGLEGRAITQQEDKALWAAAMAGDDALAVAAAERFCLSLGSVAGDFALGQGASGVVIAGGLGLRIRDLLLASGFAARFCAKGRHEGLMARIPVKLITHPQPGLLGAAVAYREEHA